MRRIPPMLMTSPPGRSPHGSAPTRRQSESIDLEAEAPTEGYFGYPDWRTWSAEIRQDSGWPKFARLLRARSAALDDLSAAAWVQDFDAAWLGQDWASLAQFLAPDVEFLSLGATTVLVGCEAVLDYLRDFSENAVVHEYNATELRGRGSWPEGIITYRWQMEWSAANKRRAAEGRDLLALRAGSAGWQLIWRAQAPTGEGGR